jgi:rhodanese-related sulfurtransferase
MMEFINENLILVSLTIFVFLLAIFNELKIKEGNICGLSPLQAVQLINQNAVIFDLRNQSEFEKKHLIDSQNATAEDILNKANSLKKPVLLVCDTGGASKKSSLALRQKNIEQVFYIKGGIIEWERASLPTTSEQS